MLGPYIIGDTDSVGALEGELGRTIYFRMQTAERFADDGRSLQAIELLTKLKRDVETLRGTDTEMRLKEALDRWVNFVNDSGDLHGKRQYLREQFGSHLVYRDDYEADQFLMDSLSTYFAGLGFRYFPETGRDVAEEITWLINKEFSA